ncbi:MAG: hypothetical protein WDW38_000409 [Sanguina aurantia]
MRLVRAAPASGCSTSQLCKSASTALTRSSHSLRRLHSASLPTHSQQHPRTSLATSAMSTSTAPAATSLEPVFVRKQFGGVNRRFKFTSSTLGCPTTFTVYFPPAAEAGKAVPVLFFLSGLECSDTNFIEKAGAQRRASELGLAIVTMDTSPRGMGVAGESDSWDFGVGAGFYVNATQGKWKNWQMFDFVTKQFSGASRFLCEARGNSLVGMFPLAVAPPCIMVDTGSADPFLASQLRPEALEAAAKERDFPIQSRLLEGYDHSYYFISTFIDEHLTFHAKALGL